MSFFAALAGVMPDDVDATIAKQKERHSQGKAAGLSIESGALDGWSLAGSTIVARIKLLTAEERASFIAAGALTKSGGLAGMAMSGGLGNVTPKDLFHFASGARAESGRMPYVIDVPVMQPSGRNQFVPSGVLKKTGTITFKISNALELEHELHAAIEAASVGPFHFGKKGIAYVQSLDLY